MVFDEFPDLPSPLVREAVTVGANDDLVGGVLGQPPERSPLRNQRRFPDLWRGGDEETVVVSCFESGECLGNQAQVWAWSVGVVQPACQCRWVGQQGLCQGSVRGGQLEVDLCVVCRGSVHRHRSWWGWLCLGG